MVILPLLATLLAAQDQPLVSANAGRPSICVSSANDSPAADTKGLADSVRDLERALRSLERKHQFDVADGSGSCIITLQVQRRIEDEEEETYTVVAQLAAATRAGQSHNEELTATEGSWRGAASAIAGKVGFFVDSNRTSLASGAQSTPPPSKPPLPPGRSASASETERAPATARTIEDGILDWVRLTDEGGRTMQTPVYVRLFASEKAELGTGGDGGKETRASEAKTVQGQGPAVLRDTFMTKAAGLGVKASALEEGATLPSSAVVIEGEFVTIDPGSRAKRYFVGFGAGKSAIEIAGRIRSANGTVIAEFRQRRIGAMGIAGGDSLGKLLADTRSCGEDLAKFVEAWLANKSLK